MSKPILVTGATGKIGGAVAAQLLSRGERVRVPVRAVDARSERLRSRGAEVIVSDMFDYDDVLAAMKGVERAFYCPPMDAHVAQSTVTFATAASDARIRSIVSLSQWLANPASPAHLTRDHWLFDKLFSQMPGITLTTVNPGFFADNILSYTIAFAAQLGQYPWPYGDSLNAWPSNEDIARVAVAALLEPERHDRRVYRPTGPKLLSGEDVVATLTRVLKRPVTLMRMPEWMYAKAIRAAGFPPYVQLLMRTYNEEQRRGAFAYNAPTDHVLQVTGSQPETFETTVRRYASLPTAQRSFSNQLRAFAELMKIMVTPGLDVDRFARNAGLPILRATRLSIDDERWLSEHHPGSDSSFISNVGPSASGAPVNQTDSKNVVAFR